MQIKGLIEQAAAAAGSQRRLGAILGMNHAHLSEMKQGTRPANWRIRGKLRALLGEEPAQAFMAAMAEDLAESENADEKKAAAQFQTMLAAFAVEDRRKR